VLCEGNVSPERQTDGSTGASGETRAA
jgi:hypothetical protein